jgi:hypothetical protein
VVTKASGYNTCLFLKNVAIPFKSEPWTGSKDSSRVQPSGCFLKKQLHREGKAALGAWLAGTPSSGRAWKLGKVGRSSPGCPTPSSSVLNALLSLEHLGEMKSFKLPGKARAMDRVLEMWGLLLGRKEDLSTGQRPQGPA